MIGLDFCTSSNGRYCLILPKIFFYCHFVDVQPTYLSELKSFVQFSTIFNFLVRNIIKKFNERIVVVFTKDIYVNMKEVL